MVTTGANRLMLVNDDGVRLLMEQRQPTGNQPATNHVDVLIAMLQRELEVKNEQIEKLSTALVAAQESAQAAQALHAGTMRKLTDGRGTKMRKWFGKK
jgi:light-regulated signal transduction histidine kinase (bacteriophytochrome)